MNELDHCKLDVYAPGREPVLGGLTGSMTAKGSLQANTSGLWHRTL